MNNIQQVLAFASAARHLSFAGAARELALSPSAVAKSVSRLERQLGVKLFFRTTRQVNLTPDGKTLFAQCERVLQEVEVLRSVAAGARAVPSGTLSVSMPLTYGKYVVLPLLARLSARYPELAIDARLTDSVDDLVREGLDAAIRIGSLQDSRLVARPFAEQWLTVCGSPAYLEAKGTPRVPQDVMRHDCILFRLPMTGRDRAWEFRVNGEHVRLNPPSRMRLSDGEALVVAAAEGLGLVQTPQYMTADAVREGRLVECLASYRAPPLPISIVHAAGRHVAPRLRVLIDALAGGEPRAKTPARRKVRGARH
jgi:LysR family transcriptional regulator, regulator for bpeEF and oprC